MVTFLVSPQLTLPGVETLAGFYHRTKREQEIEAAWAQKAFEDGMARYEQYEDEGHIPEFGNPCQHTNGVCEYVLIWSDGEDSRWAMTPSENPYL
jgi:hypothetical protein